MIKFKKVFTLSLMILLVVSIVNADDYLNITKTIAGQNISSMYLNVGLGNLYTIGNITTFDNFCLGTSCINTWSASASKRGGAPYLYNDSTTIYLNESVLNDTIDDRYDKQIGQLSKLFQGIDIIGGMKVTNIAQPINFTYVSIKDDYYSHSTSVNPSEVEILHDGLYKISAMTTVETLSASEGARGNPRLHIDIWNGTDWNQQPDNMGGYIRENAAGQLSTSITGIGFFEFNKNEKIRITVLDSVAIEPDEATVAHSSRLLIEFIDRLGGSNGTITNLKDIGDVDALAPNNGDILVFNGTTSQWTSQALSSGVDTHIEGDNIYLYNDSTTMYLNETKLNITIDERSGIYEENVSISVSGGSGTGITVNCCNRQSQALQIAVFPTTPSNKYRFSANTSVTGEVLDSNLKLHDGNWIIAHAGSIIPAGEGASYYITNAQVDETFTVRLRWQS